MGRQAPTAASGCALEGVARPAGRALSALKVHILSVGHKVPDWVEAGYDDYARRMPRELQLRLHEIKPGRRNDDSPGERRRVQAAEKGRILAAIPAGSVKIALDERGKTLTTVQFSKHLETWMGASRDVCFIIGGADGLDDELKRAADLVLALSSLTLPHALVRVVLAEQLYRAASLIRNHPYHRQ